MANKTTKVSIGPYQYPPYAVDVRATMSVEGTLGCDVCGERVALVASVDLFDKGNDKKERDGYDGERVHDAIRRALAAAAERHDYRSIHVAPVERPEGQRQDESVTACRACRERLKRAVLTALRRA